MARKDVLRAFDSSASTPNATMTLDKNITAPHLDTVLTSLHSDETSLRALEDLCAYLYELRSEASPSQWTDIKESCRAHPLFERILGEPITQRAYGKPRGYAGDAKLMDLIYSVQAPAGLSPESKRIHSFLKGRPCTQGARARKLKLAALLHRTLAEVEAPEILSVACGHMRETQLLSPERLGRAERIVAFDQDEASLGEVSRALRDCDPLSVVPGSIRRLVADEQDLGEFDLIYSLGLYDYLNQPVAQRLTQVLFDSLKPGGRLVIANYLPMEDSAFMEVFMEWNLIYRTPAEILDLAGEIRGGNMSDKSYGREHSGTIGFLELSKSDAVSVAA